MRPVEARNHEEERGESRRSPGVAREAGPLVDETGPLVDLEEEEDQPSKRGQQHVPRGLPQVRAVGRSHRRRHRGARGDQHERHQGDDAHREDLDLIGPARAGQALEPVGGKEGGEQKRIGDEEDPHHELLPRHAERRDSALPAGFQARYFRRRRIHARHPDQRVDRTARRYNHTAPTKCQ